LPGAVATLDLCSFETLLKFENKNNTGKRFSLVSDKQVKKSYLLVFYFPFSDISCLAWIILDRTAKPDKIHRILILTCGGSNISYRTILIKFKWKNNILKRCCKRYKKGG
jgi:hypothetical protein